MDHNWSKEEIALTRYAWWMQDAAEAMERNRKMREVVYTHMLAWLIVACLVVWFI